MKIFYNLSILSIATCLSCSSEKKGNIIDLHLYTMYQNTPYKLKASSLYRADSVTKFIDTYGNLNKELAILFTKKAEELISTDFQKGLYYYKKSLTLFPDSSLYESLANLMVKLKKYDEAVKFFELILALNPSANEETYVKAIKSTLLSERDLMLKVHYLLSDAKKVEKLDLAQIRNSIVTDPEIKENLSDYDMQTLKTLFDSHFNLSSNEFAKPNEFFNSFLKTNLPLKCGVKELLAFDYHPIHEESDLYDMYFFYITPNFYPYYVESKMKEERYSKKNNLYLIKQTPTYTAVIYASDTSGISTTRDMRCVYHTLATYTQNGELIDYKTIGLHAGNELRTYKIDQNLRIQVTIYERSWKKPFYKNDPDNEIVSTKETSTITYYINDEGYIKQSK